MALASSRTAALGLTGRDAPFFIVGSERSGTTLLMAMLGMHGRLAVPEVSWWYPRFRRYLHTYGDLARPENFRTLVSEMVHGLKTPFWGLAVNPRTLVDEVLSETRQPTFAEVVRVMGERYAADQRKPRWGEKTPHNLYFIDEIRADFPDAAFLHLVRDGRDVAVEQLRSAFGPRNIYAAALIWSQATRAGAAARARVPSHRWLDVRYEDLVADPESASRRILAFLGEDFDPAVLRHAESPIAQRRGQTRDHRPLGQSISSAFVGLHRTHLSLHDHGVFVGVAGEELRAANYPVEVSPVSVDLATAALWLELDARIRAATLDAPEGHLVYESYNDWLIDQREARRRAGVWSGPPAPIEWADEFLSGQRAPRRWKDHFSIKRRYHSEELVL